MGVRVNRKLTPPPVEIVKNETFAIRNRTKLEPGVEATVRLPGRKSRVRARFKYADGDGNLVFVDPANGALRTIRPDAVHTIHRDRKLTR